MLLCAAAAAALGRGDTAPDFSRRDLAGHTVHLRDYRGKVLLVNFWASWCSPCLEEMPRFSQWQRQYGVQGLQIIGVSMDDGEMQVRQFLAGHPVSYPIVRGDARLAESFGGVLGLPLSYLIDSQGRVVARYQGDSKAADMEAPIKALLARLHH